MENEKENIIRNKLDFYLEKEIPIHIKRNDRKFWNGLVIEKVNDSVYVFKERFLGLVHLFIYDVYLIEDLEVKQ